MKYKTKIAVVFMVFAAMICSQIPIVSAAYRNSNVILDLNYNNVNAMSAADIQKFLESKGSWLATYNLPEKVIVPYPYKKLDNSIIIIDDRYAGDETPVETGSTVKMKDLIAYSTQVNKTTGDILHNKTIAQLIYDESRQHRVNPQVVLAMLEKESASISQNYPRYSSTYYEDKRNYSRTREIWPLFYGYHERMEACIKGDPTACDNAGYKTRAETYGGAGLQIAFDFWFLGYYRDYYATSFSQPIVIDGVEIRCENAPTRVLFRYTPHAQTNFFNIYTRFFGYEPNTLVQNDTKESIIKTYDDKITLSGYKSIRSVSYLGTQQIAATGLMNWEIKDKALVIGENVFTIKYKNSDGTSETKTIKVYRHKLGDINGDKKVNVVDLSILAKNWNMTTPSEPMANLNPAEDQIVNVRDLSILSSNWER